MRAMIDVQEKGQALSFEVMREPADLQAEELAKTIECRDLPRDALHVGR